MLLVGAMLAVGALLVVALVVLYLQIPNAKDRVVLSQQNTPLQKHSSPSAAIPAASADNSLGGQLYQKSQNPLSDKLQTQTPVANPINDAYKNPFE